MPLPMMVPTTTADAWLTPRSRESSARGGADRVPLSILELEYTREMRKVAWAAILRILFANLAIVAIKMRASNVLGKTVVTALL